MARAKKKKGWGLRNWGLTLAILAAAAGIFFMQAGSLLIVEDPFDHADVALVLSGGPTPRTLEARDLYVQKRVDRLWVILEPAMPAPIRRALIELGLIHPGLTQWSQRILEAAQVPSEKITLFPLKRSTIEEARGVQEFLKTEKGFPSRLVLVTHKTHTRRARMIFRRILREYPIEVLAHPTPYDPFDPDRWWSRPKEALRVLNEYVKLCVNSFELLIPVYDR